MFKKIFGKALTTKVARNRISIVNGQLFENGEYIDPMDERFADVKRNFLKLD